jgi:hypothetical protein
MPEELGKIEKPKVDEFKGGRKLFFVPLVLTSPNLPLEYTDKYLRYWLQVESQVSNLEAKLGNVARIYHELIPAGANEGIETLKELHVGSLSLIQSRVEKGAVLEATESNEIMTELMHWSRCLSLGLQSQKVFSTIYGFYTEADKQRNEFIAKKLNATLKENESAILIMAEGHHVHFPEDIQQFYVAPPALDEIKRWMRSYEAQLKQKEAESSPTQPPVPDIPPQP